MNKLKLISWNVRSRNPKIKDGVKYIFSFFFDVVCLQEVPKSLINWLKLESGKHGYVFYSASDFFNNDRLRGTHTCLLLKNPAVSSGGYKYSGLNRPTSFLGMLYSFDGNSEVHTSLYVDLKMGNEKFRIQGMRLSTAVGPSKRQKFLSSIFKNMKKGAMNIVMGDLNVGNGVVFNMLTGLFRGFTLRELFYDERKHFDKLIADNGFVNVFSGKNTTAFPFLHQQFDHILLPKRIKKYKTYISESSFGSDHKMLFVECEL